jgi:hypothetical protein
VLDHQAPGELRQRDRRRQGGGGLGCDRPRQKLERRELVLEYALPARAGGER